MKQAKKIWNGANVKIRDFLASLCFSGPSFLGMLIFFVAPFCVVIYYSFIAGALDHSFVGLKNYIAVWNNGAFQIAVKNTAVFSGWQLCWRWCWPSCSSAGSRLKASSGRFS